MSFLKIQGEQHPSNPNLAKNTSIREWRHTYIKYPTTGRNLKYRAEKNK